MEFACFADWRDLPAGADAVFARAEKESIFFSRPWFENLVDHGLEDGQSMLLACVLEGDSVLAILPLLRDAEEQWQSLDHLYTALFTVLLADNAGADVLSRLVSGLMELRVYSLRLGPVADDDRNGQLLQQAMEQQGFTCHHHFRFHNWIQRLHGQTFDDYMAARPARLRNTIARKRRKLGREHACRVRLYTDSDLQQAKADYHAVYGSSWKAREQYTDFVDGLIDKLGAQGWLRLAILYIDEMPAAAQFWFLAHRRASIFRLAYDEKWKQYSPGSILISHLMQHAIDTDHVEEIDFLTGNDRYKQDWMSERRERRVLYCGRPRPQDSGPGRIIEAIRGWSGRLRH